MEEKLEKWKSRYESAKTKIAGERELMDERERIYKGDPLTAPVTDNGAAKKTNHVRNLVAEIIEAEVNSTIPAAKVTAMREEDEDLAQTIEAMLRNEVDRMPSEYLNDMQERIVPTQGGSFYHVEWDETERTHTTIGEVKVSARHPRTVIPQPGVFTGIEDMDYIFIDIPCTKEMVKNKYGVEISDESEEDPGARGLGESTEENLCTLHVAYYRNDKGGIGLYVWVADTELEDNEDYQARQPSVCTECGRADDGSGVCACGNKKFHKIIDDTEKVYEDYILPDGTMLKAGDTIPRFKPDRYPLVLQKNTYGYGQLLGDSDVDKIRSQQNTVNRLNQKVLDELCAGGSVLTLPDDATIEKGPKDLRIVYPHSLENKQMISAVNLQVDITQAVAMLNHAYEEARQTIGITDSFQGRKDTTATSGTAKQFAAQQSAGRLESKKTMKAAAWADLYKMIFLFKLAYTDEVRTVRSYDEKGRVKYRKFDRRDFLKKDADGQWYYNTDFLFSTDEAAGLENNRQAMWQETRNNYTSGAFGNPQDAETMIMFWSIMETLHYPKAGDVKKYLEDKKKRDAQMQLQAMNTAQQQTGTQLKPQTQTGGLPQGGGLNG